MQSLRKLTNKKGFTLVEIVVVLGIIAVLSAILIPITANYLSEAKIARAKSDVKSIAGAIADFEKDVGEWPRWLDGSSQAKMGMDDYRYIVLHTEDGENAQILGTISDPDENWNTSAVDDADDATNKAGAADGNGDSLDDQLNANEPLYPTAVTGGDSRRWRGPYLSNLKSDPWGNKYYVNVQYLTGESGATAPAAAAPAVGSGEAAHYTDQGKHCFVISAGPNEIIETDFEQNDGAALVIGGDDIIYEIK